jgi:hypothetical protein
MGKGNSHTVPAISCRNECKKGRQFGSLFCFLATHSKIQTKTTQNDSKKIKNLNSHMSIKSKTQFWNGECINWSQAKP